MSIMDIVSPFIQPLISCIGTPLIRQFGYLKAEENVDKLMRLAGDVEAKKEDIEAQIDSASRDGKQSTNEVRRWIEKVEGLLGGEVRSVQREYEQRYCWPNYCWSSYKIGRRASKLLIKLTDLETERAAFHDHLTTDAPPASVVEQMCSTSNVVGNMITFNKEKICGYLKEETDGVIGIWGMGGVGKTTLLEAINDSFLSNNGNSMTNKLFDHVIFIIVSKEYQVENLQKAIIENLRLHPREGVSQAQIISEYLKEKNFLLLLDDMWEVVQLKGLGIPDPRSNSERRFRRKVVFTTRSLKVCKGMNCQGRIIKVECLKEDEARNLFEKNVGEDIIDLPGIRSLAEEVIKECGGLPLALVVIGRAMATKESPQEWNYALTQLRNSQPSNILDLDIEEEYYFLRLKFSYDNLRDDKMRECFLCCSLWSEDFKINKKELIMCWMGLDLIDGFEDIKEAYDKGYYLIGSLTAASLLEPVHEEADSIKMHDVIRDLALWIARNSGTNLNKWLVKARVGLEEVPSEMVAKWGEAERVSLMVNEIKELPPHLPPCHNLSTLLLRENWQLVGIPGGFFTCMPNLTYLDLSRTGLEDIPKEICCLVQLRYLNLSYTIISTLPEELGQLINLKYLLLQYTRALIVNRGIIGRLLKLEYLNLYPYGSVETDELLRLPLLLKGVGMKITSEHALEQLSRVVPPLLDLAIGDMGGDSSTTFIHLHHHLLSSRTKQSLRALMFDGCRSIRELDIVDVRLPSLVTLDLLFLENLTEIVWRRSGVPPSECFQRLRRLYIRGCNGLKDITWILHLPCLEVLDLYDCKEMEQVVVIGGGGEEEREKVTKPTTFPRLRKLVLWTLPKLAMICDTNHAAAAAAAAAVNFPSLEVLWVNECNGLKKLPFHPQLLNNNNNCSRLKKIVGSGEWWEGIEWEDQSAKSSLQPYFLPGI